MHPGRHLDGGQGLRIRRRGSDVRHERCLARERAETLAQHLRDLVLPVRQVPLAVEQGDEHIAEVAERHRAARRRAPLTRAEIEQVKPRAPAGDARSAASRRRPVHAVLVHVESVEQMGEARVGRRGVGARRQRRVQIEGRLLRAGGAQFALVLQLRAQERVVPQIHPRRLFAFCKGTMKTAHNESPDNTATN